MSGDGKRLAGKAATASKRRKLQAAGRDSGTRAGLPLAERRRRAKNERRLRRQRRWRRWTTSERVLRLCELMGWAQIADEGLFTSSRQAEALNPALVSTSPTITGLPCGMDTTTRQVMAFSPHGLYLAGVVTSMNVFIGGDIGVGKSYLTKLEYVVNELALGHRVAVFDRKRQRDDRIAEIYGEDEAYSGEYVRLAEATGGQLIRLDQRAGQGTTINPLDPAIARNGSADEGIVGQDSLLEALAQTAIKRSLTDREQYALQEALRRAWSRARDEDRLPMLSDVVDALMDPSVESVPGPRAEDGQPKLERAGVVTVASLMEWGLPVALGLSQFLAGGKMSGLFDGPTGQRRILATGEIGVEPINLAADFLLIDTSALAEGSAALGLAVAVLTTYLGAAWADLEGQKTIITEEAYALDELGASVPTIFRSLAKRGRGAALAIVTIMHHLSDVPTDSPLWSLIRECEIVHLFRQDKADDAAAVVALWQLEPAVADGLMSLEPHRALTKLGRQGWTWMRVISTPWMEDMGDTEQAIRAVVFADDEEAA